MEHIYHFLIHENVLFVKKLHFAETERARALEEKEAVGAVEGVGSVVACG